MENEGTPPPPPTPSSQPQSSRRSTSTFYVDWNPPCIGVLNRDGTKSDPKGDFAIKLETLVLADANTGYLARVQRGIDEKERTCFFTIEAAGCKSRFMGQINNSFGSGGMTLALNEAQFASFVQYLKVEEDINIRSAATIVGQQKCNEVWVMGRDVQIDGDGNIMPLNTSPYIWLDKVALGEVGIIPVDDLLPSVVTPLSTNCLSRLVSILEVTMRHNFLSSLLIVAGGVMSLHYCTITKEHGGCPIVIAVGPSETGKTTALTAALSITGSSAALYERGTNAFLLERAALSSLPFGIDDPPKGQKGSDISDLVVDLYQGGKTANLRRGAVCPKSLPLVASNFNIRSEARVATRATVIPFQEPSVCPETDEEGDGFDDLEEMVSTHQTSSAVGWAIQLRKQLLLKREHIRELKQKLRGAFHGRQSSNWAILLFFAEQLLLASHRENLFDDLFKHAQKIGKQNTATVSVGDVGPSGDVILQQTMDDILKAAQEKTPAEVLHFMRTGVQVNQEDVLAVVLSDISAQLTYSTTDIVAAAVKGGFGQKNVAKDFLTPDAASTQITRGVNTMRRKCTTFILSKLPDSTKDSLIRATQRSTPSEVQKQTSGNEEELVREDLLPFEVEEEEGVEYGEPFMELEVVEESRREDVGKTLEEKAVPMEKDTFEKDEDTSEKKGNPENMDKGDAVAVEMGETEAMEKREEEKVEAETMEKMNVGKKNEGDTEETWAVNTKDKEDTVVNSKGKASANKGKASTKKGKASTKKGKTSTNKTKASTNKGKERKKKEEGNTLGEGEPSTARKRQTCVIQPPVKKFCTRQNTGPLPNWSKSMSPDNPLNS